MKLKDIRAGDLIRHKSGHIRPIYMVTVNYGSRVTIVATDDLTNSVEWEVFNHDTRMYEPLEVEAN